MCLAVPARVVEIQAELSQAVTETFGVRRRVGTQLVGEVQPGEYLLVHAGYALARINLAEAEEQLRLWEVLISACPG